MNAFSRRSRPSATRRSIQGSHANRKPTGAEFPASGCRRFDLGVIRRLESRTAGSGGSQSGSQGPKRDSTPYQPSVGEIKPDKQWTPTGQRKGGQSVSLNGPWCPPCCWPDGGLGVPSGTRAHSCTIEYARGVSTRSRRCQRPPQDSMTPCRSYQFRLTLVTLSPTEGHHRHSRHPSHMEGGVFGKPVAMGAKNGYPGHPPTAERGGVSTRTSMGCQRAVGVNAHI